MSIDPKKCCGTHSKEKEDKGECCQQEEQERAEALTYEQSYFIHGNRTKGETMNKLFLVLALLFALSACSVGKKCTYTQDGTKLSSYVWFYQGDKPIDLDKNNCN